MISLVFLLLAAACNAVMDKSVHHFPISIFSKLKSKKWLIWFDGRTSWKNKYVDRDRGKGRVKWNLWLITVNKPVQLTDAWHFFKMLMIIFLCISIITYSPFIFVSKSIFINKIIELILCGAIWNNTFTFCYHHTLEK